jgi:hypothetical protein
VDIVLVLRDTVIIKGYKLFVYKERILYKRVAALLDIYQVDLDY